MPVDISLYPDRNDIIRLRGSTSNRRRIAVNFYIEDAAEVAAALNLYLIKRAQDA